jgi:hypothetical protein
MYEQFLPGQENSPREAVIKLSSATMTVWCHSRFVDCRDITPSKTAIYFIISLNCTNVFGQKLPISAMKLMMQGLAGPHWGHFDQNWLFELLNNNQQG